MPYALCWPSGQEWVIHQGPWIAHSQYPPLLQDDLRVPAAARVPPHRAQVPRPWPLPWRLPWPAIQGEILCLQSSWWDCQVFVCVCSAVGKTQVFVSVCSPVGKIVRFLFVSAVQLARLSGFCLYLQCSWWKCWGFVCVWSALGKIVRSLFVSAVQLARLLGFCLCLQCSWWDCWVFACVCNPVGETVMFSFVFVCVFDLVVDWFMGWLTDWLTCVSVTRRHTALLCRDRRPWRHQYNSNRLVVDWLTDLYGLTDWLINILVSVTGGDTLLCFAETEDSATISTAVTTVTDLVVDWLADWLVDWLTDWLIDKLLIDWLMCVSLRRRHCRAWRMQRKRWSQQPAVLQRETQWLLLPSASWTKPTRACQGTTLWKSGRQRQRKQWVVCVIGQCWCPTAGWKIPELCFLGDKSLVELLK